MRLRQLVQAALLVFLVTVPTLAQGVLPPVTPPERSFNGGGGQQRQPGRRQAPWQRYVGLNPQQRQQVRPLQRGYNQARKAINQQFEGQLQAVLSPDQYAQLQQMRSEAKANHQVLRPRQWQPAVGVNPQQRQALKGLRQQRTAQLKSARSEFFGQVAPMLSPEQQSRLNDFLARGNGRRKQQRGAV